MNVVERALKRIIVELQQANGTVVSVYRAAGCGPGTAVAGGLKSRVPSPATIASAASALKNGADASDTSNLAQTYAPRAIPTLLTNP